MKARICALKAGLNRTIQFALNPVNTDVQIYQVIISPGAERASKRALHSILFELYVCVNKQLESRDNGSEGDSALLPRCYKHPKFA